MREWVHSFKELVLLHTIQIPIHCRFL